MHNTRHQESCVFACVPVDLHSLAALAGKQETKKVSAAAAGFLEGVEYTEYEEPKYKEYRVSV